MARTFESVDWAEFPAIVNAFPWTRTITEIHLHHTWRPLQRDYQGHATIVGMWRYHTETNGWSDIAQHVSIAPDGSIWLCRNFNWAPASARGFNGNRHAGPFMIEMIGDFDIGRETITDAQKKATLAVIKTVQDHHGLKPQDLRFHNEMSSKSCPGTSFNKTELIKEIRNFQEGDSKRRSRGAEPAFTADFSRAYSLIRTLEPNAPQPDDLFGAEHAVGYETLESPARGGSRGDDDLTDGMINALAEHVVNLERGQFSDSGRIETRPGDVDHLFEVLIPAEIEAAKVRGEKARLLFYAHGGLVSETNALLGAFNQLKFWRDNHVYPVFFIWETGFAETIRQVLSEAWDRMRGTRGPLTWVTDNLIEEIVRVLQGGRLWDAMKTSAMLASSTDGGAAYVAQKTAELIKAHGDDIEIHTVGHSAGSIFQAHFMPLLVKQKVSIKTAHYLAPAIRNDLFHQTVAPILGQGIGPLTLFTMTKALEKDDNVAKIYRKSLLYLIYEALENQRQTDILGLEISLRGDDQARQIFGLRGTPSNLGEVIWSPSNDAASGSASQSHSHGGFDDDKATMESVARRVLNRLNGQPIAPFEPPRSRSRTGFWEDQIDWPEYLADLLNQSSAWTPSPTGDGTAPDSTTSPTPQPSPTPSTNGRRLALCVGIDAYQRSPLSGCVADAKLWSQTLQGLGFQTELLLDQAATAETIRDRLRDLVSSGQPGDVLVLQYSGHGTQISDTSGDEGDGDTPEDDECLCAIDCESGEDGLVIDDQLRLIFDELPAQVSMVCFFDCCHSGTATRALLKPFGTRSRGIDTRARYLAPSPAMLRAFAKLKAQTPRSRSTSSQMREVLFSACRSSELAYESNGQGDFTLRATRVIASGIDSLSNRDFHDRVLQAFGSAPRQNPELDCSPDALGALFLQHSTS